ncbi:putative transposase Ptta/En/Spm plant protein [Dioscorea alata]|uniref:Transposase Ptta/En/Spm plant protein n=1 Tax=Dioscorea alata TaxID=55571 RepID=A0ACB7VKH2_DIOAL|nr:putative transposase Ptta/En/Spm plant protein [Dioscorea alata]
MPKLKLKCMKMVVSDPGTNNAPNNSTEGDAAAGVGVRMSNTCNSNPSGPLGSNRSAPTLQVASHCSIPSSSADSNHNEQEANQNNSTRLENVPVVNEAENLNAFDSNGQQKKRGRTTLKELWSLPPEERIVVSANHLGQPIGSEAQLLTGFLGMLARTGQQIGLHYESWHKVPKSLKDELFKFIELRFAFGISKEYVLKSLGKKWRDYKHDLKKRHFKMEDGLQANKQKHPNATIRWQWEQLVDFWYSNKGEDSEKLGVASRKQQKYTHTSGSKSFARKEKEMEVNSGRKVGRLEFFKATHTKKDGTHTKKDGTHMNVKIEQIMDKANEKLAECETVEEDMQMVETQILTEVIGKERCGRVRGLGLGPTLKSYYRGTTSRTSTASSTQSSEFIERFHQMEQQMQQLKEEQEQERAQREQERAQECARYNALLGFLQTQFPGVNIPGVDIVGSTSQSQDQPSGDQ